MSQVPFSAPLTPASADPGTDVPVPGNVPTVAATGACTVVTDTVTRCDKEGTEDIFDEDIDAINGAWRKPGRVLVRDTDGKAYMCEHHMWMTEPI